MYQACAMGYASVASYVGLVLLSGQEYQSRNADHERRPVAGSPSGCGAHFCKRIMPTPSSIVLDFHSRQKWAFLAYLL